MKKILLFLVCVLVAKVAYTQSLPEFAPVGAKWYYSQFEASVPPSIFEGYALLESLKDTTVDNQTCSKLVLSQHFHNYVSQQFWYMYSNNNKIYYYSFDSTRFLQLFDFNKQAGDSFKIEGYYSTTYPGTLVTVYIDASDTIVINGQKRKRVFSHTNEQNASFDGANIEGIGNLIWMFPTQENYLTGPLRCYYDSILDLYQLKPQDCDYITDIRYIYFDHNLIKIYPNPVNDLLAIIGDEFRIEVVEIQNLLGETLAFKAVPINEAKTEIDVSSLIPGTYLLLLKNREGIAVKKFVKE